MTKLVKVPMKVKFPEADKYDVWIATIPPKETTGAPCPTPSNER